MRRIKFEDHIAALEERRSKLPQSLLDMPLQSTTKPRTPSKQALLEKIKEGAQRTGIDWSQDSRKKK
jgi:hypothetical protein